jgi:hypothetical protein
MTAMEGWIWVTLHNGERRLIKDNKQYKNQNKDNSYHLSQDESDKLRKSWERKNPNIDLQDDDCPDCMMCPECNTPITKKNQGRCKKCKVAFDWT